MKDKKSIAIVMLAAITAGVGIFSIVSNQSKIDRYEQLSSDKDAVQKELSATLKEKEELVILRDQLDTQKLAQEETIKSQGNRIEELGLEVVAEKGKVKGLSLDVEKKDSELESLKLQHAQDLGESETKLQEASNALIKFEKELKSQTELAVAKTKELEEFVGKTAEETKERKQVIAALETKNDSLNQEKGALEVKIATLNSEIDETSQKLEDSEGDRVFLEGELFRLQEEKAKLVKQMNDIEFLTAQYRRIKSDIATAKRMDWMRRGIGIYAKRQTVAQKHAGLRGEGVAGQSSVAGSDKGDENVAVELTSDGRVIINGKVIEPEAAIVPEKPDVLETGQPEK